MLAGLCGAGALDQSRSRRADVEAFQCRTLAHSPTGKLTLRSTVILKYWSRVDAFGHKLRSDAHDGAVGGFDERRRGRGPAQTEAALTRPAPNQAADAIRSWWLLTGVRSSHGWWAPATRFVAVG